MLRIAQIHIISTERTLFNIFFSETIKAWQACIMIIRANYDRQSILGVKANVAYFTYHTFVAFKQNQSNWIWWVSNTTSH